MFDLIAQIPLIGGLIATVLPFIVVIGIVVFVHEYGHYIVGRWCGIHAKVFSLGFGKELVHWTDKRGTRWRVGALPLGGFVQFLGDANAASQADNAAFQAMDEDTRARSFPGAPLWARSATIAAGPIANFLLSIVIYVGFIFYSGIGVDDPVIGPLPPSVAAEVPLSEGDMILSVDGEEIDSFGAFLTATQDITPGTTVPVTLERDGGLRTVELGSTRPPYIVGVRPLSAASRAGIEAGDLIVAVGDTPTPDFESLSGLITSAEGQTINVQVRRGDALLTLPMRPTMEDVQNADGSFTKRVIIGVTISSYLAPQVRTPGPIEAVQIAVGQVWGIITGSLDGLKRIITGEVSAKNLQGPVGIAQVSGETAGQGIAEFILLIALISTAIGMMNLFPIPVLDGGHLVFNLYEAIRGAPPSPRAMEIAMAAGLAAVLSLMVFATYNDIARLLSVFA
jgi:regulator of sigma E protease